jgi:hypothetical protein
MASEPFRMLMPGLALCLALTAVPALAQNPVPDAPLPSMPSASAPARPSFALPATTYQPPPKDDPASDKSEDSLICGAPPSGVFTRANQHFPKESQGAINAYFQDVSTRINGQWAHTMSVGQRNAWAHGKSLRVRLAIRPDGSLIYPEVTATSGHTNDDEHALAAISSFHAFPPLPAGIDHPVVFCITFAYNMGTPEPSLPESIYKDTQKKP